VVIEETTEEAAAVETEEVVVREEAAEKEGTRIQIFQIVKLRQNVTAKKNET
jgi:hypothetical protein